MNEDIAPTNLPRSVWIPEYEEGELPSTYSGTPTEIVLSMAADFGLEEDSTPEEAVAFLVEDLEYILDAEIEFHPGLTTNSRAAYVVHTLLQNGFLRPMALA